MLLLTFCVLVGLCIFITNLKFNATQQIVKVAILLLTLIIFVNIISVDPWVKVIIQSDLILNVDLSLMEYTSLETLNLSLTNGILFLTVLSLVLLLTDIKFNSNLKQNSVVIIILITSFGYTAAVEAETLFYMYLALELAAFSSYGLMTINSKSLRSLEGAIKYFIGTTLASEILLLGISILYVESGTTNIRQISAIFAVTDINILVLTAVLLIIVGLLSKLAIAPLHWFTVDAYESVSTSIAHFLMTTPKLAIITIMFNILCHFNHRAVSFLVVLTTMLTIYILSIQALGQTRLKRFIVFTMTVNNAILLIPLIVDHREAFFSINLALLSYFLPFILLLYTQAAVRNPRKGLIEQLDSLFFIKKPIIVLSLFVTAISLSGIPIFGGFLLKYLVYNQLLTYQEIYILIPLIFLTLVPIYYYIRFVQLSTYVKALNKTENLDTQLKLVYYQETLSKIPSIHTIILSSLLGLNLLVNTIHLLPSSLVFLY